VLCVVSVCVHTLLLTEINAFTENVCRVVQVCVHTVLHRAFTELTALVCRVL
jgi:hypothetical protein